MAKLEILPGSDDETYLEDLVIYTQYFNRMLGLDNNEWACFIIKAGSKTNGASYGILATLLLWEHKRSPKMRYPAFGHDELFEKAGLPIELFRFDREKKQVLESLDKKVLSRMACDGFFYNKGRKCGLNIYQASMARLGLFLGSWAAFNRYKRINAVNNNR